jgi:hypothetical protein
MVSLLISLQRWLKLIAVTAEGPSPWFKVEDTDDPARLSYVTAMLNAEGIEHWTNTAQRGLPFGSLRNVEGSFQVYVSTADAGRATTMLKALDTTSAGLASS